MQINNISLSSIGPKINHYLYRYGLLTIFIAIAIVLAVSVFMLNAIIAQTDQADGYTAQSASITFDEATVQKIENLKGEGEKTDRVQTSGRLLPF